MQIMAYVMHDRAENRTNSNVSGENGRDFAQTECIFTTNETQFCKTNAIWKNDKKESKKYQWYLRAGAFSLFPVFATILSLGGTKNIAKQNWRINVSAYKYTTAGISGKRKHSWNRWSHVAMCIRVLGPLCMWLHDFLHGLTFFEERCLTSIICFLNIVPFLRMTQNLAMQFEHFLVTFFWCIFSAPLESTSYLYSYLTQKSLN